MFNFWDITWSLCLVWHWFPRPFPLLTCQLELLWSALKFQMWFTLKAANLVSGQYPARTIFFIATKCFFILLSPNFFYFRLFFSWIHLLWPPCCLCGCHWSTQDIQVCPFLLFFGYSTYKFKYFDFKNEYLSKNILTMNQPVDDH